MKKRHVSALLILSICLAYSAQAAAQAGLRFNAPSKELVPKTPRTLQLQYSATSNMKTYTVGPSFSSNPSLKLNDSDPTSTASRNNTVWADWRPFNNSLRTSAGLMWRDTAGSDRGSPLEAMPNDLDVRNRVSTPFVGLGWRSEPSRENRWLLSAELGTYITGDGECRNAVLTCSVSSTMGLRPGKSDDGIHWNSYLNFGASFQY